MPRRKALTLSIIIPAYNEENYLRSSLESIRKQTVKPDEVIVVDNNSTDGTIKIARSFPFVTVVTEKKQGVVHARNKGFNAAKGNIIGRIDADTVLERDWVEKVLRFYTNPRNQQHALTGGGYFYNIRLPHLNGWMLSQLAYKMNRFIAGHYILWGSNMAVPKVLWQKVERKVCLRKDIHEDLDLAIHMHRHGYEITYWRNLRAGVVLRRVYSDRHELWAHMDRWPRTLHVHGYKLWWMGILGNILLGFVGGPAVFIAEYVNRYILGRKPLGD